MNQCLRTSNLLHFGIKPDIRFLKGALLIFIDFLHSLLTGVDFSFRLLKSTFFENDNFLGHTYLFLTDKLNATAK